ncbi:bifunctional phosphopantothenoylcysteine decarboxylase/phosphopantothenate--cysteine ligase CoaBC [Reichenbachiella versicolor]|uniref:bifunctional phosphopantothenoylcysteine decarboxylase/phosphopantothenate--cysteine ligase CoaBC n=1 Tax=Reichenbachiella versicolor TaxID=1821036 RepID=UPI002936E2B5|nr:bifunctional phosphopantothenoylcysteine decarboxylase/phosphopantothenate--cysteine ligase CoaBC [Reichenbachiella versicolor]
MEGKKILLGVCGGIAAYKTASLVRLLVKDGYEVKVVMTTSSKSFITPLTLSTLSKNPVASDFIKNDQGEWQNHVELGLWADLMVIAPATANSMAKMANGICDNLLMSVYLSAKCPVMFAPTMDLDMYQHPSVKANQATLISYGNIIIRPGIGELASGLEGEGRMAEPEEIYNAIQNHFNSKQRFNGKKVLVTAGPTFEKIDPVRFIGNHSSGKMGVSIAKKFISEGAEVVLVSGPGVEQLDEVDIHQLSVNTADEMYEATKSNYQQVDVAIFAAAVADYRPAKISSEKIKKAEDAMIIELVKNKDIAYEMGKLKTLKQINVGFALETENEELHALGKLKKKNFDLVVLNSLNDIGAGFSHNTNKITIFNANQESRRYSLKSKEDVAKDIVDAVFELYED